MKLTTYKTGVADGYGWRWIVFLASILAAASLEIAPTPAQAQEETGDRTNVIIAVDPPEEPAQGHSQDGPDTRPPQAGANVMNVSAPDLNERPVASSESKKGTDNSRRSRRNRSDRESSQPSSSSSTYKSPEPGSAASTNAVAGDSPDKSGGRARPDYSTFRIVSDRNIFDPNRAPRRANTSRERPKRVDSFSLVGIMSYEKGSFAFFDGSSSEFQKALKNADKIAGYTVASVEPELVKLSSGTNQMDLRVGWQVRREDDGEWKLSTKIETYTASESTSVKPSPGASSPPAAGVDNDVLKRLMQRREQE